MPNCTTEQMPERTSTTRILVLSAHAGHLDRRILVEMNTLVDSGRAVSLVSVPAQIPKACLDSRIRVFMPSATSAPRLKGLKDIASRLPSRWANALRGAWYRMGLGPAAAFCDFFLQHAPDEPFDVIHCHDLETLPAAVALQARKGPRPRVVYDSHELFPFQTNSRGLQAYWTRIEQKHVHAADLVVAANGSIAKEMATRYDIRLPEVVLNSYGLNQNGVKVSETAFLNHFHAPKEGFRVIFQGQLCDGRNLKNLVRAFNLLGAPYQLFFLGSGPLELSLRGLCRKLAIQNVHFGEPVSQEMLLPMLGHAHLGVIPYIGSDALNKQLCTPNKLFEFIESEIPICATDLPELRAIIRGNKIGEVYTMDTPKNIAQAIADAKQKFENDVFTVTARRRAKKDFSWERQGSRLIGYYEALGV